MALQNIVYEQALLDHMKQKNKNIIVVELVLCNNTEFEIAELYVHLIDDKKAREFKEKKRYRSYPTEAGEVLFPRGYRLEIADTVTFGLKSFWIFKSITYQGIRA